MTGAATAGSFDASWAGSGTSNQTITTGQYSADFNFSMGGYPSISKQFTLSPARTYTLKFDVLPQETSLIDVIVEHVRSTDPNAPVSAKVVKTIYVPLNTLHSETVSFVTDHSAIATRIRFRVRRTGVSFKPRVSFSAFALNTSTYDIEQAGPRVEYDRPLPGNKVVIGVDYSVDERNAESVSNMPTDSAVRILADRGDGVVVWQTIATNVLPNDDGFIELYYNGTSWQTEEIWDGPTLPIMAVQYNVWGMNLPGAR